MQMQLLANLHRDEAQRPSPYQATDFLPDYLTPPAESEDWTERVAFLNAMFGGTDKR